MKADIWLVADNTKGLLELVVNAGGVLDVITIPFNPFNTLVLYVDVNAVAVVSRLLPDLSFHWDTLLPLNTILLESAASNHNAHPGICVGFIVIKVVFDWTIGSVASCINNGAEGLKL